MNKSLLDTLVSLITIVSLLALAIFVFMFLWNAALVPAVSILAPIGFWQAFGITILVGLLRGYKTTK